jgi:hypothetical protein
MIFSEKTQRQIKAIASFPASAHGKGKIRVAYNSNHFEDFTAAEINSFEMKDWLRIGNALDAEEKSNPAFSVFPF